MASRSLLRAGLRKSLPAARLAPTTAFAPQAALPKGIGSPHVVLVPSRLRLLATITSSDLQGVSLSYLLTYLHVNYGLVSRYIQEPLCELAHILGYVKLAADTVIEFRDANILLEEMGVPPITLEQLGDLHSLNAAAGKTAVEDAEQSVSVDDLVQDNDGRLATEQAPAKATEDVEISHKTRLFRR